MRYQDEERVRAGLSELVGDVEPSGDALPRLLAARRRRSRTMLPSRLGVVAGLAVTLTAVLLVALVLIPDQQRTNPVSVRPNSYLAQAEPGVIAAFDVPSGRQIRELATVSDQPVGALVADGEHAYATVQHGAAWKIVRLSPRGEVETVHAPVPSTALAARAGRVAYAETGAVVVRTPGGVRRVAVPPELRVLDLSLDSQGRLAVLTLPITGDRPTVIYVVEPDARSLSERPPLRPAGRCGPEAATFSGDQVAALLPVTCGGHRVRVATLDRAGGQQIGAGVPFDLGPRPADVDMNLSTDRLGRFLVSTSDARQWVVDRVDVRRIPRACAPSGACARLPAAFWG